MRLTFTRAGIAVVAVGAVLMLSSCYGGGNDGTKEPTAGVTGRQVSPSASMSTSAAQEPTATTTAPATSLAPGDSTQTVEGVWLATQGSTKVQLVLGKGKAALTSSHLCGGGYTDKDGIKLTLTCMDGDTERTSGSGVLASDGKTLKVQWADGPTDVFSRTGLPSS